MSTYILVLEILGSLMFLFHKTILFLCERKEHQLAKNGTQHFHAGWRFIAWQGFLIGLPAWLIIFVMKENWIALSVEGLGLLSVFLCMYGLWHHGKYEQSHQVATWDRRLFWASVVSAIIGLSISLWHIGVFTRFTQAVEVSLVGAYLAGTILLSRKNALGYLCYAVMNGSNLVLMGLQDRYIMAGQQGISAAIMIATFFFALRKVPTNSVTQEITT